MEPFQDYLDQARWHSQFNRPLMKQKLELLEMILEMVLKAVFH